MPSRTQLASGTENPDYCRRPCYRTVAVLGVPGSKRRKVLFACLWLLHPTAWFESGVFGQFDAIAAAFLLTCVILLIKGNDRLALYSPV